jgi:hypothetical protein
MVLRCTSVIPRPSRKHDGYRVGVCHFKGQVTGEGTARCTCASELTKGQGRERGLRSPEAGRFAMKCACATRRRKAALARCPGKVRHVPQSAGSAPACLSALLHEARPQHSVDCTDCHLHLEHVFRGLCRFRRARERRERMPRVSRDGS